VQCSGLMEQFVAEPSEGRRFRTTLRVGVADAHPSGRLRLDALARILQDVANDDVADAGLDFPVPWVARRSVVDADRWPHVGEKMLVTTWCSGLGGRWAERRTSVSTGTGARVEIATIWVYLGEEGRQPMVLPGWFLDTYERSAAGRRVSAGLKLAPPPTDGTAARPWVLRTTDIDILGHVNNAATWAAVEDEAARLELTPQRAHLEYRGALRLDEPVLLRSAVEGDALRMWLTVDGAIRAAALVVS